MKPQQITAPSKIGRPEVVSLTVLLSLFESLKSVKGYLDLESFSTKAA